MALSANWKQEPVSPLNDDASWVSEETFYLPALEHDDLKHDIDCETKAEIASKLLDNLDQLEDLDEWIKNEGKIFLLQRLSINVNFHYFSIFCYLYKILIEVAYYQLFMAFKIQFYPQNLASSLQYLKIYNDKCEG